MRRFIVGLLLFSFGALLFAGCSKIDRLRREITPSTPHEQYVQSLRDAELENTAIGRRWLTESQQALETPVSIEPPFQEVGYFDPREPTAVAYRTHLKQGRQLLVRINPQSTDSTQFFVDLFRATADTARGPEHVISARDSLTIRLEVSRTGTYLVRVQPELLEGGRYRIVLQTGSSLTFPVADRDSRAIQSIFGDPREGGRRSHHGVDIFAPRGTPAVAAADGRVHRIGTNELGGKVIWLRDRNRNQTYYYAHLDSQIVRRPQRVEAGDTLGLIGNTGNARRTPPHLHFGIYGRRPIDPFPFVDNRASDLPDVTTDTSLLARRGRIGGQLVNLRGGPSTRSDILTQMPRHTLFAYTGASDRWYRIRLPNGMTGYVAASLTERADTPVNRLSISGQELFHEPRPRAAVTASISDDTPADILGRYDDFLFAQTADRSGWITAPR